MTSNPYENLEILPLDLQGWNSVSPVFRGAIEYARPTTIIEVGTWKGASVVHMGQICKQLGLNTRIIGIDVFEPTPLYPDVPANLYQQFLSNMCHAQIQDMVEPLKMSSDAAFTYLQTNDIRAEVIYLDGDHTYEFVKRDITNYRQLLMSRNAVLFGDDYIGWPGVIQAVDEYKNEHQDVIFDAHYEKWIMLFKS